MTKMRPSSYTYKDEAQELIRTHQRQSEESFQHFKDSVLSDLQHDLRSIDQELKKQLSGVCRKLQNKIRGNFLVGSLKSSMERFFLEPYVAKEYENIHKAIQKLRSKIFQYIQNFSNNLLQRNIQKFNDISLFHDDNKIRHIHNDWYSVTSRSPLEKAEVKVWGLRRPETSWLVLGVSKKLKEYGPVRKSINNQQFLGNIYLNGSDVLQGGYKLKKNLSENDTFVIENMNRMIYIYKKNQGRNMEETFILDDNTDYYFYVAMKGPLSIQFAGQ